jgi:hypothetical protein
MKRPCLTQLLVPFLIASFAACSSTSISPADVQAWRATAGVERPAEQRGAREAELAELERARQADDLATARKLALSLAVENPEDAQLQFLASRAESDGLFLIDANDKRSRNLAAESARQYSVRAWQLGARDAAAEAQLAWTLGTTTHLQPMFERSMHARQTIEVAQRALALDSQEPTALATLAVVNLRLETLPWIAKLMASDLPESSLDSAEAFARAAVDARASRENRLILAKVLVAAEREADAQRELEVALAQPARFPRDTALERDLLALLDELRE